MTALEPGTDRLLVAELVGLLNDAEHYNSPGSTPTAVWPTWAAVKNAERSDKYRRVTNREPVTSGGHRPP